MHHTKVFLKFKKIFTDIVGVGPDIYEWWQNGRNCIRVCLANDAEYIFTYNGECDWSLETVDSFINRQKGLRKND